MWDRFKKVVKYIWLGGEFTFHNRHARTLTPEEQKKFDAIFKQMDKTFEAMDSFFKEVEWHG